MCILLINFLSNFKSGELVSPFLWNFGLKCGIKNARDNQEVMQLNATFHHLSNVNYSAHNILVGNINYHYYYYYYYYYYYGCTALCWALSSFSVSWSYTHTAGLIGRVISPSQGLYLHTEQHKRTIKAHNTNIHASIVIRTHDPSVRAS
jgi:hypothetical protein